MQHDVYEINEHQYALGDLFTHGCMSFVDELGEQERPLYFSLGNLINQGFAEFAAMAIAAQATILAQALYITCLGYDEDMVVASDPSFSSRVYEAYLSILRDAPEDISTVVFSFTGTDFTVSLVGPDGTEVLDSRIHFVTQQHTH
jgi:hypothetical protein